MDLNQNENALNRVEAIRTADEEHQDRRLIISKILAPANNVFSQDKRKQQNHAA